MRLVAWCVHGCFGCWRAAARTHAGGAFVSACRTRLGGGDRQGWWLMLQSHRARRRQPGRYTLLILVRMLMRCLRKSGLDRRHMAEAVLTMRDVMSQEEEPSFVIRDPIYVKESTNTTSLLHIFNGRWLVVLGVIAMSFVFG